MTESPQIRDCGGMGQAIPANLAWNDGTALGLVPVSGAEAGFTQQQIGAAVSKRVSASIGDIAVVFSKSTSVPSLQNLIARCA